MFHFQAIMLFSVIASSVEPDDGPMPATINSRLAFMSLSMSEMPEAFQNAQVEISEFAEPSQTNLRESHFATSGVRNGAVDITGLMMPSCVPSFTATLTR